MNTIQRFIFILSFALLFMGCEYNAVAQDASNKPGVAKASTPSKDSPIAHLNPPMREGTYPYDITLRRADGTDVDSKEALKSDGKPTIVSFWLTTCGPCKIEFAAIKKKYAKWQAEADFNMVAISTDFEKNYPAYVKMVNEEKWPWDVYNDVNRLFWRYMPGGLNGLPQVFIYDKNGEVVYYKRKYRPGDEDMLFAKVKELQ